MKEIKVKIKSLTPVRDSSNYKYLISYPPQKIKYIGAKKGETIISQPNLFKRYLFTKKLLQRTIELSRVPNIVFSLRKDADIFHCSHCLLVNDLPWVVDFEHYWSLSITGKISYSNIGKRIIKQFLKKDNCKQLLPWTFAAKNSLDHALNSKKISDKTEVIYPAVPVFGSAKQNGNLSLLYVGRYFYSKGGLFFVKVVEKLKEKYDFDATLISYALPKEIKEKYKEIIKFFEHVDEETLFKEIYPNTSIFVYPGFVDTFGFALLEAMSFGIPIVTADAFARNEIIENGKNGFILKTPKNINQSKITKKEERLVSDMVEKISLLLEDSSLRKKMGQSGKKLVEKGRFSIKTRNSKLREVYEQALRY